jgi:hypothetical protein
MLRVAACGPGLEPGAGEAQGMGEEVLPALGAQPVETRTLRPELPPGPAQPRSPLLVPLPDLSGGFAEELETL